MGIRYQKFQKKKKNRFYGKKGVAKLLKAYHLDENSMNLGL